jgi:hypothetical protein
VTTAGVHLAKGGRPRLDRSRRFPNLGAVRRWYHPSGATDIPGGAMGEWTAGHMSECPAIVELKAALLVGVPWLAADPTKVGTTRGDGSRHDAGLAMDIMLDSRDIAEKAVADQIIEAVVQLHARMQWHDILYTDWNGGKPFFFSIPGNPPFGGPKGMLKKNPNNDLKLGNEHINHIHIDWWSGNPTTWPPTAKTTGFKAALVGELQKPPKWLTDYMKTIP